MEFVLVVSLSLVLSVAGIGIAVLNRKIKGQTARKLVGINVAALFGTILTATVMLFAGGVHAFAATDAATAATSASAEGMRYIAAAMSTGLAAIGAGIAVASTGSAALGAISEDPKLLGKTLIIVGLAEGIALYGMIITVLILNA